MARLDEYLKNLQKDYPPQPAPPSEEVEQKAEAYDYLVEGEENPDE